MKRVKVNYAYKPAMHAHAANFIRKRLRTQLYYRKRNLFGNFKHNMNRKLNNSYKVGWSAPDAVGTARRAQYKWRRAYFMKHGHVI